MRSFPLAPFFTNLAALLALFTLSSASRERSIITRRRQSQSPLANPPSLARHRFATNARDEHARRDERATQITPRSRARTFLRRRHRASSASRRGGPVARGLRLVRASAAVESREVEGTRVACHAPKRRVSTRRDPLHGVSPRLLESQEIHRTVCIFKLNE